MADSYISIEAPSASKLAELVEDIPIRENYVRDQTVGDRVFVTVHEDGYDDPQEILDIVVEESSVKASQAEIK